MSALSPPPVRLQLFIGPAVPLPAPRVVLDALEEVTVETGSGDTPGGFDLVFRVPKGSPLQTLFLLSGGAAVPILRVVVAVTVGGTTEVLIDGVVTDHQVQPHPQSPRLRVRGRDLTAVMDIIPLDGLPYPAMPPAARALLALAKYAALGCVPLVIPSVFEDVPLPIDRIPRHKGTDLGYLRALAEQVGHVFYIDPGPLPGMSKAYWGPEIRVGVPQPALNAGLDGAHDNVTGLRFDFEKTATQMPVVYIQEPISKVPVPIPIPDINPLAPPLGVIPSLPITPVPLPDTAKLNPVAGIMRGLGHATRHSDSITGRGSLDVARYGRVLRSRQLVGVRGAGDPFNGLYYVTRVTHAIKRGQYTQDFTLSRNGLLSTLPVVPT